ncbi:hypothetical protein PHYBLDRAFT_166125 [Phycomyces blakesleeanus NRRL 1555(-)]|uniref:Uncharacterized protein n=1 Tax=Phycomyces blakesleeanus (strain ATCC 8743b / DSM 1359 / FGSC 10004 / NBRC 33097 / NRRL 1555) TaxID=763407 RepID=A0A162UGY1_PHYB8|nr:hypothetical protein PHYBLDRAFT_166125 [Phycomyces blakesleeanus NRRL 1555(-)]OAD76152.1 hypothetical protein PHYBLDRAFT_166125 [Phycomyces blakesleeanus NRRL 1555(-)]|eukprot:XP_018294192.1 hypothetical protein PHYBLDRAFT_166125 [Phycomyces blakesleeanus NRRL 1555(-)]
MSLEVYKVKKGDLLDSNNAMIYHKFILEIYGDSQVTKLSSSSVSDKDYSEHFTWGSLNFQFKKHRKISRIVSLHYNSRKQDIFSRQFGLISCNVTVKDHVRLHITLENDTLTRYPITASILQQDTSKTRNKINCLCKAHNSKICQIMFLEEGKTSHTNQKYLKKQR